MGDVGSCVVRLHVVDIDECNDGTHTCADGALCENLMYGDSSLNLDLGIPGTFECSCPITRDDGWVHIEGDGYSPCVYEAPTPPTCQWVDSNTWTWANLPGCDRQLHAGERFNGINGVKSNPARCHCTGDRPGQAGSAYPGPMTAAQCTYIVCHQYDGNYLWNSCTWDGEVCHMIITPYIFQWRVISGATA
jgi:hypothetical protein